MFYLIVAVVLAIVCTLLNLLLTFGVIRKLRAHDTLLASGVPVTQDATVPVGSTVEAVTAVTVDGRPVSSVHPDGSQLVAFFSPGCAACEERVPEFIRYRERNGVHALAVVVADDTAGAEPYVARLSGTADVLVEGDHGAFATAFGVTSYPALALLDRSGVVLAAGNDLRTMPEFLRA